MALLESCVCCSLLVASVIVGVYAVVAYVVAFTIELWWILEAEATLPAPAYLLCAGYFFIFIFSAMLLHGLTVKRTLYLLGWLFVITIFSFPEAGLVLFMSLHFWVKSLYGRMELIYWIFRVLCNIAGIVCVQSLYSTWKEEKLVMRRLHDLNMTPVVTNPGLSRRGSLGGSSMKNGSANIGYQNAGFVNSTARLNVITPINAPPTGRLRRSASSVSQIDLRSPPMFGGSLPANNFSDQMPHFTPLNNSLQYAYFSLPEGAATGSEFNASTFEGLMAASVRSNSSQVFHSGRGNMLGLSINRTQSLVDLRKGGSAEDLWRSDLPFRPISMDYSNYIPATMTQSLDRRVLRLSGRLRRASSVDELSHYGRRNSSLMEGTTAYRDNSGRIIFYPPPEYFMYRQMRSNSHNSKRSLAESDDMQKIRDVAL